MPWFAIVSFTYGVNVNNTKTVILSFDTLPFRQYTYAFSYYYVIRWIVCVCVCVFKCQQPFSSCFQPYSLTKFNRMIFHIEIIHIFDVKSFNRKLFYVSGGKKSNLFCKMKTMRLSCTACEKSLCKIQELNLLSNRERIQACR